MGRPKEIKDGVRLSVVLSADQAEQVKRMAMRMSVQEGRQISVSEAIRMAVPLKRVMRLEEIWIKDLEVSGNQEVVQYRGEIMPLIPLAKFFGKDSSRAGKEILQVVVFTYEEQSVGMIVDQVIDIVEESVTVMSDAHRLGVEGKAVVAGRVTDMLDVDGIIQSFFASERVAPALIAASGSE